MIIAARLYSILISLLVVGSQIPMFFASPTGAKLLGSLVVTTLLLLPIAFALASLGREREKLERTSLLLNKIYLFLAVAAAIGFAFQAEGGTLRSFALFAMPASLFALSFILNILALQRQQANGRKTHGDQKGR